ncbi:hypothetical protein PSCLAVI8L_100187 [Pseudoclavibacter sp. 8L]|nr:hypothetical protein PSCLAVI8L_100187 [Pseudoclavibacter sp. 8L]
MSAAEAAGAHGAEDGQVYPHSELGDESISLAISMASPSKRSHGPCAVDLAPSLLGRGRIFQAGDRPPGAPPPASESRFGAGQVPAAPKAVTRRSPEGELLQAQQW